MGLASNPREMWVHSMTGFSNYGIRCLVRSRFLPEPRRFQRGVLSWWSSGRVKFYIWECGGVGSGRNRWQAENMMEIGRLFFSERVFMTMLFAVRSGRGCYRGYIEPGLGTSISHFALPLCWRSGRGRRLLRCMIISQLKCLDELRDLAPGRDSRSGGVCSSRPKNTYLGTGDRVRIIGCAVRFEVRTLVGLVMPWVIIDDDKHGD